MINQRVRTSSLAGIALLVGVVLVGCIQPVSDEELAAILTSTVITYTPTLPPSPTYPAIATSPPVATVPPAQVSPQPTTVAVSANPVIEQFVRDRGYTPNNLEVWDQRTIGPDQLYGFSYTNQNGEPCVGFLLTALINGGWQPNNGGLSCGTAGTPAVAGVTFFSLSDGQPYTIAFGRVDDPAVSAVAIVYQDNSTQSTNLTQGGFMFLKPGVAGASVITAIDAFGNTVIENIPQVPPV